MVVSRVRQYGGIWNVEGLLIWKYGLLGNVRSIVVWSVYVDHVDGWKAW